MINDAQVFLSGYVATDPAYWQNPDGNSKTTLRVAYTPRHVDRSTGEWTDSPTSFVTVICWRKLADNVALCLRKGEPVVVRGRMQVRQYDDKDGNPRLRVDVDASSIGHDLARGVALFQRTRRSFGDATPGAAGDGGEEAGGDATDGGGDARDAVGDAGAAGDVMAAVGDVTDAAGGARGPAGGSTEMTGDGTGEAPAAAAASADGNGSRNGNGNGARRGRRPSSAVPDEAASRPAPADDADDDVLDDRAVAALIQGNGSPPGQDGPAPG